MLSGTPEEVPERLTLPWRSPAAPRPFRAPGGTRRMRSGTSSKGAQKTVSSTSVGLLDDSDVHNQSHGTERALLGLQPWRTIREADGSLARLDGPCRYVGWTCASGAANSGVGEGTRADGAGTRGRRWTRCRECRRPAASVLPGGQRAPRRPGEVEAPRQSGRGGSAAGGDGAASGAGGQRRRDHGGTVRPVDPRDAWMPGSPPPNVINPDRLTRLSATPPGRE